MRSLYFKTVKDVKWVLYKDSHTGDTSISQWDIGTALKPNGSNRSRPLRDYPKNYARDYAKYTQRRRKICIEGDSVLLSMIELEILLNTQQYIEGEDEKSQGEQNIFTEKNILGGAGYSFELESFT